MPASFSAVSHVVAGRIVLVAFLWEICWSVASHLEKMAEHITQESIQCSLSIIVHYGQAAVPFQ